MRHVSIRRVLSFLAFFTLVCGILYITTVTAHAGLITAFTLSRTAALASAIIMGVLSVSFIVSTILGMRYYNAFTRLSYTISSVWMGILTYLCLATLLSCILGRFISILPSTFFVIALGVSLYGVLHARQLVVTPVSVALHYLPQSWVGKTAVWISDVHLGQLYGATHATRIVDQVERLHPDIIFVGGDLFDGTGAPDIPELVAPLSRLNAPLGTYFITGNHEEYGNRERFLAAVGAVGMRVLDDELVEIDGLQLIGVDYRSTADAAHFARVLDSVSIDPTRPSILLKHEPRHLAVAHAAHVSFQISGHTHEGQLWPLGYVASLVYQGYAYGLKKFASMHVYVSSGTGTWGPPMRVGTRSEIVVITFSREEPMRG